METATDNLPEGLTVEMARDKQIAWLKDPVLYFTERLGIPENLIDEHEKKLLRTLPKAIRDHKAIVVPSANAMGKDWTISGRASLWFYECFAPCKVIMTAPTERQTIDVMWSELKTAYNNRPVKDEIGRMTTGKLTGSDEHFILAFTTKEGKEQVGKFQGFHSPRLMIIVSEAQAVDDSIFEQIESITMAGYCIPIYLGNPLTNVGRFAKMIEETDKNIVIPLDAYDCINVKEKRQVIPGLVSWDWVKDKEDRWNPDGTGKDPRYQARVRGKLPTSSINAVVSRDLYDKCINRSLSWWSALYGTVGVDPALTGTDDMVITIWKSGKLEHREIIPYNENETVAAGKIQIQVKAFFPDGGCVVVIDSDGLGIKVKLAYDKMVPSNLPNPIQVIEYRGSCNDRKIVDPQFENIRAEAHFYAKQRMMDGHISIDDDLRTRQEATSILYFTNGRGRIQIEDKEDLKSRLARGENSSPNSWDSSVCGIWGFRYAQKIKAKDSWASSDGGASILPPGPRSAMTA